MKFFGGGAAKKDTAKESIVSMREHLETLGKRETFLSAEVDKAEKDARTMLAAGKREKARDALKRKKRRETELDRLWGQISSLEQQLAAIESANLNKETVKVMERGAATMKGIYGNLDIDKVDQTMDDIRDQFQLGDEVSEAISRPLHETDDVELEDELDQLEQEALDDKMINVGKTPAAQLPEVPATAEEEDEDAILEQLKAEMAV